MRVSTYMMMNDTKIGPNGTLAFVRYQALLSVVCRQTW